MRPVVFLAVLPLLGCAALSHTREFGHRPTEMGETETIRTDRKWEPCRVYVVPAAPEGAKRVGSIRVPSALAAEGRMDDGAREYACDLKATHAVKEAEVKDKAGPMWLMGLFRE